ncbi:MAG: hypothetical protein FJY77_01205 [Candidatus Altiarchaeales archaeon]|nr:hypothetical protein [Candidatus Altiarchaeales archaeon]
MKPCYDLCLLTDDPSVLSQSASLGWSGICVAKDFEKARSMKLPDEVNGMEVYLGAIVSNDVEKKARLALDFADLVLVNGGNEEVNRQASECCEVDILLHPELNQEKDAIDFKKAGLDHVLASLMAENGVALGLDFSRLLNSYGRTSTLIAGRIMQNVKLALKYKVPVVLCSCASGKLGLKSPQDFKAIHSLLGIPQHLAAKIVSDYPAQVVEKMRLRNNPNVLMKGLEVSDWGGQKPQQKRKYGWY